MVRIIGYKEFLKENGEMFYKLKLEGGAEIVQSKETGKHYLKTRTTYMSCTFGEDLCKRLIGTEMAGSIIKTEVDPYDFTVQDTGEVITLNHSWEYSPLESSSPVLLQESTKVATEETGW